VIGATSLLILTGDLGRFTRDVDLTVALEFNEFERLTMRLAAIGWTPAPKLEHRWIAPRRTIVDLLPAGADLRRCGSITWPASRFKMSLAGFDHVFTSSVEVNLPGGMTIRVAPPIVTAPLKIVAWVDDPYRRAKDRQDIRIVLRRYEQESDRPSSMRNSRISNSQTRFSSALICVRWRPPPTPDSRNNFSDAFWLRTKRALR
jgi:predicted nucleotidyltransferase